MNSYRNTRFFPAMASLASLHSELSAGPNYMGSVNVLNNAMWQRDTCSHIAVEKSSRKEFVTVIVSRADPQKLNCGPEENHIRADISPLHKAKFQFQPFESLFAEDFDKAIQNLEGLQAKFSETTDGRNMIVSDKNIKLVRFIFEQRKQPIPKHAVYLPISKTPRGQKNNSPVMDAETENWPIPMKQR
ncbi:hypothetical protein K503DRAFT_775534 [Rhizopogon vinicolor AM-OR11-026]|uniref:Uncharacterized protein n=1 Tax=Rhizopogon vinicolor AM-OR11-026 TaxID=1314800 RepID=A0A1B7MLP0_9AGAM|nr:hypothetical protein K503DRAFT_775534 [Rhizopogon vinicolor AM-OR11-026]